MTTSLTVNGTTTLPQFKSDPIEVCRRCGTGQAGGGDCACGCMAALKEEAQRRADLEARAIIADGLLNKYWRPDGGGYGERVPKGPKPKNAADAPKSPIGRYVEIALPRSREPAVALERTRTRPRDLAGRVARPWWLLARLLSLQWLP